MDESGKIRSALWPRIIFVIWMLWVLALAYMSRHEWGKTRQAEPPKNNVRVLKDPNE